MHHTEQCAQVHWRCRARLPQGGLVHRPRLWHRRRLGDFLSDAQWAARFTAHRRADGAVALSLCRALRKRAREWAARARSAGRRTDDRRRLVHARAEPGRRRGRRGGQVLPAHMPRGASSARPQAYRSRAPTTSPSLGRAPNLSTSEGRVDDLRQRASSTTRAPAPVPAPAPSSAVTRARRAQVQKDQFRDAHCRSNARRARPTPPTAQVLLPHRAVRH